MEDLFFDYENSPLNILEKIAIFHIEMIKIQPFPDANKKTSRIIMNFLLVQNGYPTISLKEFNCKKYRQTLNIALEEDNLNPAINYFIDCLTIACEKQEEIIRAYKKENSYNIDR